MTQPLKEKQLPKGKKSKGKKSSWASSAERALTLAQHTSTFFSIFTTGFWVMPERQGSPSKLCTLLTVLLRKMLLKFHSSPHSLFFHTQELPLSALLMLHLMLQRDYTRVKRSKKIRQHLENLAEKKRFLVLSYVQQVVSYCFRQLQSHSVQVKDAPSWPFKTLLGNDVNAALTTGS